MPDQSAIDSTAAPTGEESPSMEPYVIAVGASAGGLDALERFFQALPVQTGAAFVVIQHLSPDHKSMMGNLLGRYTSIPVATVEDGMTIEPDHIYLIPPASMMSVSGSELHLRPKSPRGLALPIDLFFGTLARAYKQRAIGVILSGTGSDGTRGAVAINDAGGLLLAQDPETAKFDGMPRSVIATGLVDAILPPEELGPRILDHISHAPSRQTPPRASAAVSYDHEGALEEALHLLHHQGGINFRDYKPATVMRRVERRMQVRHVPDLGNYVRLLDGDISELHALRRELLIPVTNFFRDTEAFEALAEKVIMPIVKEHTENQPIRAWVPGVSTGEEAYSIAILFAEAFDKLRRWPDFKLFATDVEQHNVDTGSAGMFSESIAAEVSPERLERFFFKRGNHYVVKNDIRHNIVFAKHNLLEDPPFTRMDLISCRNLLIYFRNDAQERALRRLQYALAPGGYLFLGSSETISSVQRDFSAVSSKHKLYRVLRHGAPPLESNLPSGRLSAPSSRPATQRARANSDAVAIDASQSVLLRGYAPISLLLNSNQELMHVFGDVSRYLSIGEGTVSLDIGKLLPGSLAPVAQALLHKVMVSKEPLRSDIVRVELANGEHERLRLVVRHVPQDGGDGWLLLSFEPEPEPASEPPTDEAVQTMDMDAESSDRLQTLERELAVTRESLQATIEELETANEELQATNEELMASNEELQSSNEELQSVNEELYTVNSENQEKIEILNRLNADLDSMAKAAAIATVFVDNELKLTRFTPEATKLFKIRDADLGRSIDDFTNLLDYPDFYAELKKTIEDGEMLQREVTAGNDRVYLARVLPYAVRQGAPRGAVATFVDVTTLRDIERMQAVLDSLPEHIAVLDAQGRITMINHAWRAFACGNGDPNLQASGPGSSYLEACQSGTNASDAEYAQAAAEGLQALLNDEREQFSMEYPCHSPDLERWFVMHAAPIKHPARGVVVSHIDISAWNRGRTSAD
ncbi:chemotaxis protein CheR [Halochromatium glycolicum]|uniref:Chemotaxis protein CheR n=2 Tax=Halochromatium glycolicum TaxID=85075 RepID=A0AAJ0X8K5_9GAMM|nr:chemotaxis protein CheR [Halochromatium glycolicum]